LIRHDKSNATATENGVYIDTRALHQETRRRCTSHDRALLSRSSFPLCLSPSLLLSLPLAACTARASFPEAPLRRVASRRRGLEIRGYGWTRPAKIKPRVAAPRKVLRLHSRNSLNLKTGKYTREGRTRPGWFDPRYVHPEVTVTRDSPGGVTRPQTRPILALNRRNHLDLPY